MVIVNSFLIPPTHHGVIRPGLVVRHRDAGYRGVVVHGDSRFSAGEAWYAARHERPHRDQPWYHILVDGSASTGYVAEEDLVVEPLPTAVAHPLIHMYFHVFAGTEYARNDRPWPEL